MEDGASIDVCCKHALVPITALQCVNHAGEDIIICGEGCMVTVLSHDGKALCRFRAFPDSNVIHGFRIHPSSDCSNGNESMCFVAFGQKSFKILELTCANQKFNVTELSALHSESDWLLDVQWISLDRYAHRFQLAMMTAHNRVLLFDSLNCSSRTVIRSEINCILYSALLRHTPSNNHVTMAAGSVFNDVFISSFSLSSPPPSSELLPVSLLLKGHEGVIFGVQFSEDCRQVVTVSDDRSIRIWSLPADWEGKRNFIVHCSKVFYGHTSRVWSARWLSSLLIVSVGEDATTRLWDLTRGCVHVETGHKGCNIWSIGVDVKNSVVVTGGGDCGIRRFNYKTLKPTSFEEQIQFELPLPSLTNTVNTKTAMAPRILVLLDDHRLLCLTDIGTVFETDLRHCSPDGFPNSDRTWNIFHEDPKFSSYAVMSLSPRLPLVALGGLEGHVKLIHTSDTTVQQLWRPHSGKVFSLTWLMSSQSCDNTTLDRLLSCGPEGEMICWSVSVDSSSFGLSVVSTLLLNLPPSKHRWVTSGVYLSLPGPVGISQDPPTECIVCGDRKGSVFMYIVVPTEKSKSSILTPCQSYNGIHGPNGVTSITRCNDAIYSTGRDGYCRQFVVVRQNKEDVTSDHDWKLIDINKFHPLKGVDWIEKIVFTESHGLIVQAYHGNKFILHSDYLRNPLLSVSCGGGHRSSALSHLDEIFRSKTVLFCFIKGSCVYGICSNVSDSMFKNVLKESFIGREVMSLCCMGRDSKGSLLVAVGSEDCSITLVSVTDTEFHIVNRMEEHISTVKALCPIPIGGAGQGAESILLLSGGGRASLKAWTVHKDSTGTPVHLCSEHNLHNLPPRPQRRSKRMAHVPPECRVVSLTGFNCHEATVPLEEGEGEVCVVAGCSDGMTRIYFYSLLEKSFRLIETIDYHKRCVLVVKHVMCHVTQLPSHVTQLPSHVTQLPSHVTTIPILCTCATDGDIALWNLQSVITKENRCHGDLIDSKEPLEPLHVIKGAHQSGINDIAIMTTPTNGHASLLAIASVGEDNALAVHNCLVESVSDRGGYVTCTVLGRAVVSDAHYSIITGVCFLSPTHILTSSVDQRLSLWNVVEITATAATSTDIIVNKTHSQLHNIADPSSLLVHNISEESFGVLVGGVGLQYVTLTIKK